MDAAMTENSHQVITKGTPPGSMVTEICIHYTKNKNNTACSCLNVSAVSLGEVIARQAAEDSVQTEDNYCQTSPTLLQSLRRSLNERVNRASHTPKSRRTQTNNFDNPPGND